MKLRVNYELQDGTTDYFSVVADTIEEVCEIAKKEVTRRSGKNVWLEEMED